MADRLITVFGGSGFLGRRIVMRLAEEGADVRVAVRRPERAACLFELGTPGRISAVHADVWDEATVAPALAGAAAVVNTVGHYVERGRATFEAIHGQGALHVARAAAQAGIRRLVHISGIGADPDAGSPYIRARGIGERLVRDALPEATILRPSVMVGPDGGFLTRLADVVRTLPVVPLFGSGAVRLQPVHVDDVAAAAARALDLPAAEGKVFELGGPQVYTYKSLVQLVLDHTKHKRLLLPVPYWLWDMLAVLTGPLPRRPISRDQVNLLRVDNVVSADALSFAELGIEPMPLERALPTSVGKPRDAGAKD